MHVVALAWIYVVLPLSIVLYIMSFGSRRRRRDDP
jgi:hypothetical protein